MLSVSVNHGLSNAVWRNSPKSHELKQLSVVLSHTSAVYLCISPSCLDPAGQPCFMLRMLLALQCDLVLSSFHEWKGAFFP